MTETITITSPVEVVAPVTILSSCHNIIDIDHETGNTSQYDSIVGSITVDPAYSLAGTNYGAGFGVDGDSDSINYGKKNFSISGNAFSVRFYISRNGLSIPSSGQHIVTLYIKTSLHDFASIWLDVIGIAGYNHTIDVYNDDTSPAHEHYMSNLVDCIEIRFQRESSDGAVDGKADVWINGISGEGVTNLYNYNLWAELTNAELWIGCIGYSDPQDGIFGVLTIDEIIVNDTGEYIGP